MNQFARKALVGLVIAAIAVGASSCGKRGKLKRPSDVAKQQQEEQTQQ